jgi:predicted alpha/beta hydrolase family esterase
MPKRVIIIHGYGGSPEINWIPWLKAELEKQGIAVSVPAMPNTDAPQLSEWLPYLQEVVGEPDENTASIGSAAKTPNKLTLYTLSAIVKLGSGVNI